MIIEKLMTPATSPTPRPVNAREAIDENRCS